MVGVFLSVEAWDNLERPEGFLLLPNDSLSYGLLDYLMQALLVLNVNQALVDLLAMACGN